MRIDEKDQPIFDEFAGKAMEALIHIYRGIPESGDVLDRIARRSYTLAEAMMRERHERLFRDV